MLKIGAPSYINSLPLFYPFLAKKVPIEAAFIFETPSQINKRLISKEIDIGLISSACFLKNQTHLSPITSFGIGAVKESMSVCLFTKKALHNLHERPIGITKESETSTNL